MKYLSVCSGIEAAYNQPDSFVEQAKAEKPEQFNLLGVAE